MPAMAGIPSARAKIAACAVGPPCVVQIPRTVSGLSCAVSVGVRSCASRITGCFNALKSCFCTTLSLRCWSARLTTSRTSTARWANRGLSSASSAEACCSPAMASALTASMRCSSISLSAVSLNAGSCSMSAWASKIAASLLPILCCKLAINA